jgi:hypothetical protein
MVSFHSLNKTRCSIVQNYHSNFKLEDRWVTFGTVTCYRRPLFWIGFIQNLLPVPVCLCLLNLN